MAQMTAVVGIDVSKAKLDACIEPAQGGAERQVANTEAGFAALLAWLAEQKVELAVMEASGGYERGLAKALRRAGLRVRVVDPKRIRHFAKAFGKLAKNDRIDARMIARFGLLLQQRPEAQEVALPEDPQREALAALLGARQDLVLQQTSLRNQIGSSLEVAAEVLRQLLAPLAQAIAQLERRIAEAIGAHPPFARLALRLAKVPGLGPIGIAALIAWLPELGRLGRRQIAALLGVAPYDDDSAGRHGQRRIRGGRTQLRNVLFMASLAGATRHNPVLNAHYLRLLAQGKAAKVAIIACLRKLITILNVMIAKDQDWMPNAADRPVLPTPAAA